jgi:hypothetical protein
MIALGAICAAVLLLRKNSAGHTYKGRSIEDWVTSVRDFTTVETNQNLRAMMAQLGTNALSPLLGTLTNDERAMTPIYRQLFQQNLSTPLKSFASDQWSKDTTPRYTAAALLPLLPDGGASAIPALETHSLRTNAAAGSFFCLIALANIGPRSVPALRRLETNSTIPVKSLIEGWWEGNLQRGSRSQRERFAVALAVFDPTSYQPIPILADMCDSHDAAIRNEAFAALTNLIPFHAAARDAMKKVAAESPDETLRERAKRVIEQFYSGLKPRRSP